MVLGTATPEDGKFTATVTIPATASGGHDFVTYAYSPVHRTGDQGLGPNLGGRRAEPHAASCGHTVGRPFTPHTGAFLHKVAATRPDVSRHSC